MKEKCFVPVGLFLAAIFFTGCPGSSGGGGGDGTGGDVGDGTGDDVSYDLPNDDAGAPDTVADDGTPDGNIIDVADEPDASVDAPLDLGPDLDTDCTQLTATGTIEFPSLGVSLDASTATVTADLYHRQDVDPVDGGCVGIMYLELAFHDSGCELELTFGELNSGYGGLVEVNFSADSFCPGFPDNREGSYALDMDWASRIIYLPKWFGGPATVPESDAGFYCFEDTIISFPDDTFVLITETGRLLEVLLDFELSGDVASLGSTDVSCVETDQCASGYHDGGDGWCALDGECHREYGIVDGECCPVVILTRDNVSDTAAGVTLETGEIAAQCHDPAGEVPFHLKSIFAILGNDAVPTATVNLHLYTGRGDSNEPTTSQELGSYSFTDDLISIYLSVEGSDIVLNDPFCIGVESISGSPMVYMDNDGVNYADENWFYAITPPAETPDWFRTFDAAAAGDFVLRPAGAFCEPE